MPHFGNLSGGLGFDVPIADTSFSETHHTAVVIGSVTYYLPLQVVGALSTINLEDNTPILLEDGTPLLTE